MEILEIIKTRRSIRRFEEKEIPQEVVEELKEALVWAPSAGNLQSRNFYFVFNQDLRKKLAGSSTLFQKFIGTAPLLVVACGNQRRIGLYGKRGRENYLICDVAASIENMMLLAVARGLGTCWIGAFKEEKVSKILNIPKYLRPIALIPVGWPAQKPMPHSRISKEKAIKEIK